MLRTRVLLSAAVAIVTFFVSAHALLQLPSIPDTDSYYHLAVARLYGERGFVDQLEWARFSVMHDGFGDKEPLFHALLIPFASATGGRLAVAAVNAFLAGAVTFIATGAMGAWGASIAPLLFLTAPYFWSRSIRLRPEALSVTLMILVIYAAARRRPWLAGILAMAFALTHTPWHALAGLAVLWLFLTWMREKIWEWRTTAAILGGIVLGLLIHPHFPFNLKIWFLQNVVSIQRGAVIGMSTENVRPPIHLLLTHNAGWFLAVAAALLLVRPWREKASREALFFAIPALVFTAMQLLWERMSTYFFPIATLAIVLWCGTRLTRKGFALIAILAIAASTPFALRSAQRLTTQLPPNVERDWEELGKSIPPGAQIAATWGATDAYVFWAPQGRYLNVLDPAMMLEKNPDAYWAHRAVLEGTEPDIPLVTKTLLDSDYLAFPKWEATPLLIARVSNDPRLVRVYDGYNVLLRLQPSDAFITDWNGYPRFLGFINADRIARGAPCATFTRTLSPARYELAPWGPTRVWLDERPIGETRTATLAILGRGRIIEVGTAAEVRIETCRAGGRAGFYLVRR
ncbi:MAG TPA: hypothetical protein VFV49_03145 [Thermoanaerobaculia bacterium]|nr:hypothetical protein [Thermoanaerobaculia bacterium]